MSSLGRIQELADIAGRDDPRVRRILENAERFPESRESGEKILLAICAEKRINLAKEAVFDVPSALPVEGRFLGTVLRGDNPENNYRHPDNELSGNEGIFGISGTGKSSLVGLQGEGWIEDGLSVIIFDIADEYTWLINRFGADRLMVMNARDFPIGLFVNPIGSYLKPLAWLSRIVGVLRETWFIREGSCNLLAKIVGGMYRDSGVLDGLRDYPTIAEVFQKLVTCKFSVQSRHASFLETLVNRFHGLLQSFPGMNARRSLIPEQVLKHSLIIRMCDLNPGEIDVFVSVFLGWLMSALEGSISHRIRVVLVMEEAHLLTSRQKMKKYDLGEPIFVRILRMGRKHGVSVVVVDQSPSELAAAVVANLSTRISFRLSNAPCIQTISYSMGLNDYQAAELAELQRRRAIVQTAGISKPFMMEVVDIRQRPRPALEEVEQRVKESLALLDYELPAVDLVEVLLGAKVGREKEPEELENATLRGDMLKVMARICEAPFEVIKERCEALSMDRAREGRARKNLEKIGMIELGDKVGAKWQLYVPTHKGIEWANKMGMPVHRYKSGVGHERMVRKVREALGSFSQRVAFVSAGEGLGVANIQPDLVARVRGAKGDKQRILVIQVCSMNKPEYEARRALELCRIRQVDLVILIAKNKSACRVLDEKVKSLSVRTRRQIKKRSETAKETAKELKEGEEVKKIKEASDGQGRKEAIGEIKEVETFSVPVVLDFETCVSVAYDWSWVIG